MPTTERMKPISLFVPFEPIERRSKDEPLIVSGYCFVNETVEGEGGIVLERAAMEAATPEYMQRRTIREMHGPHAAGVAESVDWDERGCHLTAKIVDPVARMKVEEGVYRGFSLKIRPLQRMGNRLKAVKWAENSLVDDPADPDCDKLLIHRADDLGTEQEVEVEVLDETPSPAEPSAAPDPDVLSESQPTSDTSPTHPSGEASPVAGASESESAAGVSSTEEQRAALIAAGLSPELAGSVEVVEEALQPKTWTAGGATATIDTDTVQVSIERAQTSETVPVRENLEPKHCREHDAACERGCEGEECKDQPGYRVAPDRVAAIAAELEQIVARAAELQREMEGGPPAARASAPAVETPPAAAVEEPPPAAPETVSRAEGRDDPTEIQRLTAANSELLQRLAAHEETLTRLAASEAEVKRLKSLPLDREKPPVRYPHALSREFIANLGNEGEQQIAVLRADYEAAKKEAAEERDGDRDKLNRATERMILRASQLAEHGIYVS